MYTSLDPVLGDVGLKLRERGYELDVRRPVIGEKLPESMNEHDVAVIYGGPPSANDNLDYIKLEIDWIYSCFRVKKTFAWYMSWSSNACKKFRWNCSTCQRSAI